MFILSMLIIMIAVGIGLIRVWDAYHQDSVLYYLSGLLLTAIFGLYLILHLIFWATASYNYGVLASKREAFIETLRSARENNNPIELAAIAKDIAEWNQQVAEEKYNNSVFLLGDYVDDRIDLLLPLK